MEMFYSVQSLHYCGCDHAAEVASVLGGLTFLHFEHFNILCLLPTLYSKRRKEERKLSSILPSLLISRSRAG